MRFQPVSLLPLPSMVIVESLSYRAAGAVVVSSHSFAVRCLISAIKRRKPEVRAIIGTLTSVWDLYNSCRRVLKGIVLFSDWLRRRNDVTSWMGGIGCMAGQCSWGLSLMGWVTWLRFRSPLPGVHRYPWSAVDTSQWWWNGVGRGDARKGRSIGHVECSVSEKSLKLGFGILLIWFSIWLTSLPSHEVWVWIKESHWWPQVIGCLRR